MGPQILSSLYPPRLGLSSLLAAPPDTDQSQRSGQIPREGRCGCGFHAPLHPLLSTCHALKPTRSLKSTAASRRPLLLTTSLELGVGSQNDPGALTLLGAWSSQNDRKTHLPRSLLKAQASLAPVRFRPGTSGGHKGPQARLAFFDLSPTPRKGKASLILFVHRSVKEPEERGWGGEGRSPGSFCLLKGPVTY